MSQNDKKYSQLIKDVEDSIQKIQTSKDVDDVLSLFETATQSLKACDSKLKDAKGRFEKMIAN